MGVSIDSSRPIMAPSLTSNSPRSSQRLSMASFASETTNANINAEVAQITSALEKLENKKLQSQRFEATEKKTDLLNTLALGAKLERALGRRMQGQDATMKAAVPKRDNMPLQEKAITVTA